MGDHQMANSIAGNQYPNRVKNVGGLDVEGLSQISGARSAMIRHRGQFPKTIWQRGAIFSSKKSRAMVSQGKSPQIRKKAKASLLNRQINTQFDNQRIGTTYSEANNRFTNGSFYHFNNLGNNQTHLQQRKTIGNLNNQISDVHHLLQSGENPANLHSSEIDSMHLVQQKLSLVDEIQARQN